MRFQDIRQIGKYHGGLTAFDGAVALEHRLAYDNSIRLSGEALSPIERELGRDHPVLARIRALRTHCR